MFLPLFALFSCYVSGIKLSGYSLLFLFDLINSEIEVTLPKMWGVDSKKVIS